MQQWLAERPLPIRKAQGQESGHYDGRDGDKKINGKDFSLFGVVVPMFNPGPPEHGHQNGTIDEIIVRSLY